MKYKPRIFFKFGRWHVSYGQYGDWWNRRAMIFARYLNDCLGVI